jgi:hypothetical protein
MGILEIYVIQTTPPPSIEYILGRKMVIPSYCDVFL